MKGKGLEWLAAPDSNNKPNKNNFKSFNNWDMPNPKRRHSQQRSAKRRTHYKATTATLSTDSTTGELHVRHRAHVSEGKLYYKGKVLAEKSPVNK